MELQQFLEAFAALGLGWKGLLFVVAVLGGVYGAKKGGLVATGDQARLANIVLALIMGVLTGNVEEGAIISAISSIGSALLFELLSFVGSKIGK